MKKLHTHLARKYPWYASWHAHPRHSVVHYGTLALFILFIGAHFFYTNAQVNYGAAASKEVFAATNGLRILKEGEYAITISGGKGGGKMVKQALVVDGVVQTVDMPEGAAFSVVEYDATTTTYISEHAPNVSIRSMYDFTGYDGTVDRAIESKLAKKDTVPVIVRLKLPGRFYDAKDTAVTRATKSQAFNTAKASVASSIRGNGKIKQDLQIINGLSLDVNAKAFEGLKRNPNISLITLDREVKAFLDTSVDEIGASSVWGYIAPAGNTLTGNGMRIAIIDTGVDYTHSDLGGCFGAVCKVAGGYDFVNNDTDPMDDQGHGTHVAATAAGNGLLKGVAPDAKIFAYKVLDAGGSGSSSTVITGIQRATDPNSDGNPADHVDVASMSLGGFGNPDDDVSLAVDNSTATGVVHTIAAGNSGPGVSTVASPGVARTAITVAAACKAAQVGTQCANPIASFSSRGPVIWNSVDLKKPDIAAPGVLICAARWGTSFSSGTPCFDDHHIRISGTSMATPHMAGVAALLKQANPTWTPAQIKQRIKDTARPLAGMTYNDQGAGEVDVKTAIPLVSKVTTSPSIWKPATDPTKKISTSLQNFSVTSSDTTVTSLTFSFTAPVAGITFTPSKTTLDVSNRGTDSFIGTLTVDNDVVPAGQYTGIIYLMQNGVRQGAIVVPVTVSPTVAASVTDIDYGVDSPSLATWTSDVKQITFTNKRTDIAQTLTVSSSTFPNGITYQINPTTLSLPINGSATLSTSFTVNNTVVSNNTYSGTLTASNAMNAVTIPTKFLKFYAVTLQDANAGDFPKMVTLSRSDGSTPERITVFPTSDVYTVYLNTPGTYAVSSNYYPSAETGPTQLVLKENVLVDGATTVINNKNDAKNQIILNGTRIDGTTNALTSMRLILTKPDYSNEFGWIYGANGGAYVSDLSSNHGIYAYMSPDLSESQSIYLFGGRRIGLSSNWSITNTVSDLKKVTVQHDVNKPAGSSILPLVFTCSPGGSRCSSYYSAADLKTTPFSQDVYSSLSFSGVPIFAMADMNDTSVHKIFSSPRFDIFDGTRKLQSGIGAGIPTPIYQNKIYNGLGPTVWFSKFNNDGSKIEISSSLGENQPESPVARQDYALGAHDPIPYTISKNGSQIAAGNFSSFNPVGYTVPRVLASISASSGVYEFHTSFPYQDQGKSASGTVDATFNTGLSDPNPPFITRLYYYAGTNRADVYVSSTQNRIEIDIDPNGGALSSVTLQMSADGGTYTSVPLSGSGTYTATLPAISAVNKITLRLIATDAATNSLQYTFDVPVGTMPVVDTIPPAVSLTAPVSGSTVSGTSVVLSANASDAVGVIGVKFLVDGNLIGTEDTTAPYSVMWNSSSVSNGSHTITAVARDAAGNVSTSSQITVTVNNVDTTPPTVAITSPANNAVVPKGGTVSITASANDNVGVVKFNFYINNTLTCSGSSAPTCSWKVPKTPVKKYTITAKAYDAAGNVGTSPVVTVISSK